MPGFNRKGPEGMGPMTGGSRGICNSANRSFSGRGASRPAGRGKGRGFGYNRNPGARGWTGNAYNSSTYFDSAREEESLRSQASDLKNELKALEKRLKELENAKN